MLSQVLMMTVCGFFNHRGWRMCGVLQVAKVVAPKKAKLAEAEALYQEVMVGLTAKQKELQVCS